MAQVSAGNGLRTSIGLLVGVILVIVFGAADLLVSVWASERLTPLEGDMFFHVSEYRQSLLKQLAVVLAGTTILMATHAREIVDRMKKRVDKFYNLYNIIQISFLYESHIQNNTASE
jgi:hypothetical protein